MLGWVLECDTLGSLAVSPADAALRTVSTNANKGVSRIRSRDQNMTYTYKIGNNENATQIHTRHSQIATQGL